MDIVSLIIGYTLGVVTTIVLVRIVTSESEMSLRRLLNPVLLAGVSVPVLAALIFMKTGNPGTPSVERHAEKVAPTGMVEQSDAHMMGDLSMMAARLAAKLEKAPDNADGWALLARTYVELKQHQDAVNAFAKAAKLIADDPQLLADYADALAVTQGGEFDQETKALIEKALKIDPSHTKALLLSGTIAFKENNYAKAISIWTQLQAMAGKQDMALAQDLASNIAEAEVLMQTTQ